MLADFDIFCADQLARVRASGPRHEPEDDPLPFGTCRRFELAPDRFDVEVRA